MLCTECGPFDEIFTHIDSDTGEVRHFNASAMARDTDRLLAQGAITRIWVAMDETFIAFVHTHRGVEEEKITRLCEPYLHTPVLGIDLDDSVLTVDGHHRLVRLHREGATEYEMYRFPAEAWGRYVVTDVPAFFSDFLAQDAAGCVRQ